MYNIKSKIFLDLTKNQKSDFLSFVKIFTRNYIECDSESIFYNILDELTYYKDAKLDKFSFIDIDDNQVQNEIKLYIDAIKKHYAYKESMRPIYEEQKRIQKEIRARIQDEKQKKEPPTKKQISYYKSLAKKHNIDLSNLDTMSKYDIKIAIQRLIETPEIT